MNVINKTFLIIILCVLVLLSCTSTGNLAGAGSETTNSLTGTVASVNGTPEVNAIVRLIPSSYDPVKDLPLPDSLTAITNSQGNYEFHDIDTGKYNIFVRNQSGNARALVLNVHAITDTVFAQQASLKEIGAIRIIAPENVDKQFGYAYVPGTPFFTFLNSLCKMVLLDSIPSGEMPEITYSSTNNQITTVVRYNVLVKPADTVIAANPAWTHSRRLFLNTTSSGASITKVLYNFPVLVRLNQSSFNFTEAKADGADLRFTTPDNRQLPFEIERWDAVNKEAEIWVQVDTIKGNNNHQFILMYWGNSAALSTSNSKATFETSRGFEGVWHLAGEGTSIAYDATSNGYHGTPYSMSATSSVKGAIGLARSFDGSSSYIVMKNTASSRLDFPEDGVYSMSLWVYAETIDSIFHAIAGKGHEQYYMQFKCIKNTKATWEFVEFQDQKGWEYTQDSIPPAPGAKQWIYLTGVRSGTSQMLYINGEKVIETVDLMRGSYDRNANDDFMIGSYGRSITIPYSQGWSFFNGKIDEVRVSSVVPNDDWIKLCYMNQKADDALVIFDK